MRKRKGSVTIYFAFIVTAIFIITIAAIFIPMGVLMNTELYAAGEQIMLQANTSMSKIQDTTVKNSLYNVMDGAFASQQNNIEVNAYLFKYSWILVVGLTAIVLFLFSRRIVEVNQGGFI
jgi:hypothetical protein